MAAADTMTQWDLADRQALQLELSSAAMVTRSLRRAAAALTAMLLALGARYADEHGQIPPQRQAEIRAALDAALAGLAVDAAAETTRAVAAATALAVRQETRALRALGVDAKSLRLRIADPVLTQAGQSSTRVLAAAIGDAQRFAASVPLATVAQLEAVAAKAAGIAPRVEANVRFLTNRAINETTRELVREAATLAPPPVPPAERFPLRPGGFNPPQQLPPASPPPLEPARPPLVPPTLVLVWVAERNACLTCLALSGHVSDPNRGIGFDEDATFSPHGAPPVWPPGMPLLAPPRHPNCRCRLRIIAADNTLIPQTLRLNAQRSVLRGFSGSDSNRSRMTAARRLLAHGTRLPGAVHERAARDLARGRFTKPRGPLAKRRYPQSR